MNKGQVLDQLQTVEITLDLEVSGINGVPKNRNTLMRLQKSATGENSKLGTEGNRTISVLPP